MQVESETMNAVTHAADFADERARHERRQRLMRAALASAFVLIVLLSVGVGAVPIHPLQTLAIVASQFGISLPFHFDAQQEAVLLAIRLPRVGLGAMVGAGLAASGAALQGLFRNQLADPALVGVSSGAALAAVALIVLGAGLFGAGPQTGLAADARLFVLPGAAFVGGLVAALAVQALARGGGQTLVTRMLLAGIAVNALTGALTGLLTFTATDAQLRNITFWMLGSLGGATWRACLVVAPFILLPLWYIARRAGDLNALLLGESEAAHLGVNVERVKRRLILCAALAVGAGVALTGIIGFIGLVVPHLLRLAVGADNRFVLAGSALLGASLLLLADVVARTILAPAELPIGIVTALVGAPFFLWLLVRGRAEGRLF